MTCGQLLTTDLSFSGGLGDRRWAGGEEEEKAQETTACSIMYTEAGGGGGGEGYASHKRFCKISWVFITQRLFRQNISMSIVCILTLMQSISELLSLSPIAHSKLTTYYHFIITNQWKLESYSALLA